MTLRLSEFINSTFFHSRSNRNNSVVSSNPIRCEKVSQSDVPSLKTLNTDIVTLSKKEKPLTGWVFIPSKMREPDNYQENAKKLQGYFKNDGSQEYRELRDLLVDQDYYVYLDKGKAKALVRVWRDNVIKIQSSFDDRVVPPLYSGEIDDLISKNNFKIDSSILRSQIFDAKLTKKKIDKIKNDLKSDIQSKNYSNIFRYMGIDVRTSVSGKLSLSEYKNPKLCTFEELGIDEQDMITHIGEIRGDADFRKSSISSLCGIKTIGGNVYLGETIENSGALENIGGSISFVKSPMTDTGSIKTIGGNLSVGGALRSLKNVKNIGGDADLSYSKVETLGDLERIDGNANFDFSKLKDLGKLKTVKGNASFRECKLENLGSLETIGGNAVFDRSQITSLYPLKSIGGNGEFRNCTVSDIGQLESVAGMLYNGSIPMEFFKGVSIQNSCL